MTKKNIEKLQILAQDFLQYRYSIFCSQGRRDADWNFYEGATSMIAAFGGDWKRFYHGKDHSEEELNNPNNYSHVVWFPNKEACERLNEDAWK